MPTGTKKDTRARQFIHRTIMPLPKPKPKETQSEFISRCIADPIMSREFPDREQRGAVCYYQYNNAGQGKN